jgi:tRNA(fMet)-specific endonuclease VapC
LKKASDLLLPIPSLRNVMNETVYLLDTTIFSELMREHRVVEARVERLLSGRSLCACPIVRGEVIYGLERMPHGRRRREFEAKAAGLFDLIPCQAVPAAAGDYYGRIRQQTEAAGLPMNDNDIWIAATALALGAVLVTRDSDFVRVADLVVEDWIQPPARNG